MNLLSIVMFLFLSACASLHQENGSSDFFNQFERIQLGSKNNEVLKILGDPQHVQSYKIEGTLFSESNYRKNERDSIQLIIDPSSNRIVEKTYFPPIDSKQAQLSFILKDLHKGQNFLKIKAKCSSHGEVVYVDRGSGIFIVTRDRPDALVSALVYGQQQIVNLRILENEKQRCLK